MPKYAPNLTTGKDIRPSNKVEIKASETYRGSEEKWGRAYTIVKTKRLESCMKDIINNTRIHALYNLEDLTAQQCLNTIKQKLPVYAESLRRYQESSYQKFWRDQLASPIHIDPTTS